MNRDVNFNDKYLWEAGVKAGETQTEIILHHSDRNVNSDRVVEATATVVGGDNYREQITQYIGEMPSGTETSYHPNKFAEGLNKLTKEEFYSLVYGFTDNIGAAVGVHDPTQSRDLVTKVIENSGFQKAKDMFEGSIWRYPDDVSLPMYSTENDLPPKQIHSDWLETHLGHAITEATHKLNKDYRDSVRQTIEPIHHNLELASKEYDKYDVGYPLTTILTGILGLIAIKKAYNSIRDIIVDRK